jgi:hypothetical protein
MAKGGDEDRLEHLGHGLLALAVGEGVLDHGLAGQGGTPFHHHQQQGGDGQNPQAAHLDQQQDDQLAEQGQLPADVQDRQAGDAAGRGGHEERIHQTHGRSGGRRRQHEQGGAHGDQQGESQDRQARRGT